MESENTICEISPSQLLNLKAFTLSIIGMAVIITAAILADNNLILVLLVVPVVYSLWKWLEIKNTKLKITDQRIILREGILNKTTNELNCTGSAILLLKNHFSTECSVVAIS